MSHPPFARATLVALVLTSGCLADDADPELDLGTRVAELKNLNPTVNAQATTYELDMPAGRLNKVPVQGNTWYGRFSYYISGSGIRRLHFRASCVHVGAPTDECDPALIVKDSTAGFPTAVTNSVSLITAVGGQAYGFVDYYASTETRTITVVALSRGRGTAHVNIQWDDTAVSATPDWDTSHTWTNAATGAALSGASQTVGGTLVRLGPVTAADVVAVRTPTNGADVLERTRMWLYDTKRKQLAFVDGATSGDQDPSFTFSSAWSYNGTVSGANEVFAVVARDVASTGPNGGSEGFVQLTRAPAAGPGTADTFVPFGWASCTSADESRPDCVDNGAATALPPGRYLISIWAATSHPVGELTDVHGSDNDAELMDTGAGHLSRGQANDLALRLELVGDGIKTRNVPRAVLGTDEAEGSRITMELTVPDDGVSHSYRLGIRDLGDDVTVLPRWAYRRDFDAVELKVATANIEYGSGMQTPNEYKNIADLFGRGPNYPVGSTEVVYRRNQGYWRWEADILNFNEVESSKTPGPSFQSRLEAAGNLQWNLSEGTSVDQALSPRRGPVLVDQLATPLGATVNTAVKFDPAHLDDAGCNGAANRCWVGSGLGGQEYYTVPARAAFRATTTAGIATEVPVAVFHLYLSPGEEGQRSNQTDALIEYVARLMQSEPEAFSNSGRLGDRLIILGDSNMANSQWAEGNKFMRKLRERFGYAVDTAQAAVEPETQRVYDMHYGGVALDDAAWTTDPQLLTSGMMGDCTASRSLLPAGSAPQPGACPFHFEHASYWNAHPDLGTSRSTWFPWWHGTSQLNSDTAAYTGSSRLDMVILVGMGWADDDPVRQYHVPTTRERMPNPTNGSTSDAIDIRHYCSDPDYVASASADNYAPELQVTFETGAATCQGGLLAGHSCTDASQCVGGTCVALPKCPQPANTSGSLTYRSDHKPVGVRLRSVLGR